MFSLKLAHVLYFLNFQSRTLAKEVQGYNHDPEVDFRGCRRNHVFVTTESPFLTFLNPIPHVAKQLPNSHQSSEKSQSSMSDRKKNRKSTLMGFTSHKISSARAN